MFLEWIVENGEFTFCDISKKSPMFYIGLFSYRYLIISTILQ